MTLHRQIRRNPVGRAFFFATLLGLACYQFYLSILAQRSFVQTPQHTTFNHQTQNPYLLTARGNHVYLYEGNADEAQKLYQQALIQNPFFIPAWIKICELKNDSGDKKAARAIFSYLSSLTRNSTRYCWEKALLGYQLEQYATLADDLSYIIAYLPQKRRQALKLAFSIWTDPNQLFTKIGNGNITHLFSYALHKERLTKAIIFWPKYEKNTSDKNKIQHTLRFIQLLMHNNYIPLAKKIWRQQFQSKEGLYNGNLAKPPLQTAFGWRISKQEGFQWELIQNSDNSDEASLHIHFTGTENLQYMGTSQNVPLTPGKSYSFSGLIRSQNISTDQRPFIEIAGFKCKAKRIRSDSIAANQGWTKFKLFFTLPQGCEIMTIRFRRDKSNSLDNLLGGDIWVKDMKVEAENIIRPN